jgi:hypothetical protein
MLSGSIQLGHAVARLRHCATSRKAAGSIPGRTRTAESTQPLRDEYGKYFRRGGGVKATGAEC